MAAGRLVHRRAETTPAHGDPIRCDVRRPEGLAPRTAVLVAHGFKGFKDWGFFPHVSDCLSRAGHLVVSFNFSLGGVGPDLLTFSDLDGFGRNTFSREMEDFHWMLDGLRSGEWSDGDPAPERVGVLGHSRGGGTSILLAREHPGVDALVTWASVATFDRWTQEHRRIWSEGGVVYIPNSRTGQDMPLGTGLLRDFEAHRDRLDVLSAAAAVSAPWLIVHGSEDPTVDVTEARDLHEAAPGSRLEIVPGAGHTFDASHPMESVPPALRAATDATVAHFETYLRRTPDLV